MRYLLSSVLLLMLLYVPTVPVQAGEPVVFVMQLTRSSDSFGHRRALLQIDRTLSDLGEENLKIEVVAYEDGIHALLADNKQTAQLVSKLHNRGVVFKACRISMNAWDLKESDFPLEVEFVPAGAPEVIKLQMQGYKYWRP